MYLSQHLRDLILRRTYLSNFQRIIVAGIPTTIVRKQPYYPFFRADDKKLTLAWLRRALRKIPVNGIEHNRFTVLMKVTMANAPHLVSTVLDAGPDVNFKDDEGKIALHYAAIRGNLQIIQQLLAAGALINAQDMYGWTPLHLAYKNNLGRTIIKYLSSVGADFKIRDNFYDTPPSYKK